MSAPDGVSQGEGRGGGPTGGDGWGGAAVRAIVVLIASFVGLVIVPDRLLAYLATRAVPRTRDMLALLWVVVVFVALSYAFVALQRRRTR